MKTKTKKAKTKPESKTDLVDTMTEAKRVLGNYKAHGFCGVLPKPYSLEQLHEALRAVVVT